MKFEQDDVEVITMQVKGGIVQIDDGLSVGQHVTILVDGIVTDVDHKLNLRNGNLTRHHVIKYDECQVLRRASR